ncbi:MAG TPA: SusC/RagA family TonB-linked outer membrane protein [Bacteroidales bacterium]|jgi:TonB-linked SusC/RagA family outer membrane protein|nr:SusC/RagA family TonB-linked outer membrane protein [Bacteroidales bacterium]HQH23950.1 SusC/RagA family TonB-linked outer membrane protein [Bacteroidales bacterium]HQJ81280.1 SusC/RagA family TonB-linked outer membrane protein [Bacteroidales bacterium]
MKKKMKSELFFPSGKRIGNYIAVTVLLLMILILIPVVKVSAVDHFKILPDDFPVQNIVTGKVTDAKGESLPGVTVAVKGTNLGTLTDIGGRFSISNIPDDAVLVFSFVGLKTLEISVAGQASIDVSMEEEAIGLAEVVVIGYGTALRKDFTGTVGSLNVESSPVAQLPKFNALESLKGSISGLNIGSTNTAGGQPSMLIRGQNSISGSNDPLIVLDGVIYLGSLGDINPNDIASFDVLKDAVSAAAYGSRSANGVIAITTKKGLVGKPLISFKASSGIQTWQNMPVMMKGEEWITVVNARNQYTPGSTEWMKPGELANLKAGKETIWLEEVTRTGVIQDYQIAVSGANPNVNYYFSSSYDVNKGIIVGDDFNRLSFLAKLKTNVAKWLEIGLDAGFSRRDYSGFSANIGTAQVMSPYGVMYRDDKGNLEKYPYTQSGVNPLWGVINDVADNKDIRNNFRLNAYSVINIPWVKGLSYRLNLQTNLDKNESGNFYFEDYYIAEGEGLERYSAAVIQGFLSRANGNIDNNSTYSYVFDNILNYKHVHGDHSVDVTAVATRDFRQYKQVNSTGSDFAANGNTTLGRWGLHKATVQKVLLNAEDRANIGYYGRLNYSFGDRYFFTGSYRRDGASVFGANNKWANFFAAGTAYKISNEPFFNIDLINSLKLKLSWGQNGNQGISPYGTLSTVANAASGGSRYEFSNTGSTIYYGLYQSALGNADLGWETTESWNAGFESEILNNRISVDMDVYFSKTTDQIFTRNIPAMTGFNTIKTSMGQVNNTGIEFRISSVNIKKSDWSWNSSFTFWKNNNKLVHLYGDDLDGDGKEDDDIANSLFIGKSLGAIYGYEQDGIVQENDAEYIALTGAAPGAPKYKDHDKVPGITANDRIILGYTKENFRSSLSNIAGYRNFELYVMIMGIFGGNNHYLKSNTAAYLTSGTGLFNANMTSKPYWTPENKSNLYPSATFAGDGRYLALQSRGFVRIQDVSLSYTFNKRLTDVLKVNSLKAYLSVQNMATFTNWFGGDPETGTTVRENTYPVPSTFSVGINATF